MVKKLNREWHLAHPMPKNPTDEQRLRWHLEHAKNCQCRPIPQKLLDDIKKLEESSSPKRRFSLQ